MAHHMLWPGKTPRENFPDAAPRGPDGCRVYAIGDIHGRADLLGRLHGLIAQDARRRPAGRTVVVYIGDYVDRGPESAAVIDLLLRGPPDGIEARFIKGNHEDFLLRFLDDPAVWSHWSANGGEETLESYGIDPCEAPGELRRRLAEALPPRHLDFLRALATHHVEGDYFFVHAGVRPGIPFADQRESDLLWIRDEFLGSDEPFGKIVVHGHSIQAAPDIRPNRIGIDTGAYRTGRLTCLVIEGDTRRFLET